MTVNTRAPVSGPYPSDGVKVIFNFTFKVIDAAHMSVFVSNADGTNGQLYNNGITIDPNFIDQDNGGDLQFRINGQPVPAGKIVAPIRNVPYDQPNRIGNQGRYYPELHERTFDYLEMQIQQLEERLGRAILVNPGSAPIKFVATGPSNLLNINSSNEVVSSETPANEKTLRELGDAALAALIGQQGSIAEHVFESRLSASMANIKSTFSAILVLGDNSASDGIGGVYIDVNNGSSRNFTSLDGRTWYFVADVSADRLRDGVIASRHVTTDPLNQSAILNKIGGLSFRQQDLSDSQRAQIIVNTGLSPAIEPTGRLTLIDGLSIASSDVANSPYIHYTAIGASFVPLWDGVGFVPRYFGNQLSLKLTDQAADFNIDLYIARINGVMYLVSGEDWQKGGGDSNGRFGRGTGPGSAELETINGITVNKFAQTVKYGDGQVTSVDARMMTLVGTFRPLITGYAEDSRRFRNLSNVYNSVKRPMMGPEIYALNHQWEAPAWHTVNSELGQFIGCVQAVTGRELKASFGLGCGQSGGGSGVVYVGIGHNTNAFDNSTFKERGVVNATLPAFPRCEFSRSVLSGYHVLYILEKGAGVTPYVNTWSADFGSCRLIGECLN